MTINFGVGGNDEKRISDQFEFETVLHLLMAGAVAILDKGLGMEEANRSSRIINQMKALRKRVLEVKEDLSFAAQPKPDLIAYEGGDRSTRSFAVSKRSLHRLRLHGSTHRERIRHLQVKIFAKWQNCHSERSEACP